jgi:hypothetical protein
VECSACSPHCSMPLLTEWNSFACLRSLAFESNPATRDASCAIKGNGVMCQIVLRKSLRVSKCLRRGIALMLAWDLHCLGIRPALEAYDDFASVSAAFGPRKARLYCSKISSS